MITAAALALEMFVSTFRTREVGGLAEWMEKNIIISSKENPGKPGPYDSSYTPLVPKLLDEFEQSQEWDELHVQKSSQSSLSFHALGILTRKVAENPGNAMYVIDSDKEAAKISKRLTAFLEDSPATSAIMTTADDDLTILSYEFPDMMLWLTGAGSVGSLANKTATLGISDETDKHRKHKSEANTVDLLRSRLKEQIGAKLLDYSTPTTVDGQIHREYLSGSRHKAFVPCPHCAEKQELVWEGVKFGHCKDLIGGEWDMHRVARETYYECSSCKGEIHDHHKREMLSLGEWRPTNFRTVTNEAGEDVQVPDWFPKRMSAHYSDLYSQNENVSFGELALKFLEALKDPKKMRNFLQNHLGLPDAENAAEVTEDKILALRGPYRRQQIGISETMSPVEGDGQTVDIGTPIPIRPLYAALLADTQDENSKWTIQAFSRNGDQYVIDWGSCIELIDLDDTMLRSVRWSCRNENGDVQSGEMPVTVAMIDEGGHRTFEVRQYAYARFPSVFTSRGSPGGGGSVIGLRDYRIRKDDENAPTMPVVVYDDNTFKRELYIRRIARFDAEKAEAYGQNRLWLPVNLESSFTAELMKEKLIRNKEGRLEWNKPKGNDWGDTVKMGGILDTYIRPGLLLEGDA